MFPCTNTHDTDALAQLPSHTALLFTGSPLFTHTHTHMCILQPTVQSHTQNMYACLSNVTVIDLNQGHKLGIVS